MRKQSTKTTQWNRRTSCAIRTTLKSSYCRRLLGFGGWLYSHVISPEKRRKKKKENKSWNRFLRSRRFGASAASSFNDWNNLLSSSASFYDYYLFMSLWLDRGKVMKHYIIGARANRKLKKKNSIFEMQSELISFKKERRTRKSRWLNSWPLIKGADRW